MTQPQGSAFAKASADEAHARLSPSGSKKWFACPGSITLEEPIPNESSTYSDDGVCMHEVAAWCLTEHRRAALRIGDYVVVSRPDEATRKAQFDEDMADLVQGYVDAVYLMSMGCEVWVEQRVNFSEFSGVPDQFGTADVIVLDERNNELIVCDLKTGYKPVHVERNSQLMTYALGTLAQLRDLDDDDLAGNGAKQDAFAWARAKGIKSIRLTIYQPRADGQTEDKITLEELEEFAGVLKTKAARVERAKRDHGVIPIAEWNERYLNPAPNAEECAFCRAMPTCPNATKTLQEFMMDGFERIIDGDVPPPADRLPVLLDLPEQPRLVLLNRLMHLAPFVEAMITAVRAESERVLLEGGDMPDYGLDTGRKGARHFFDEEEAETLLNKTMRLNRDLIYNRTLKTPTQLEKLTRPTKKEDGTEEPPVLGGVRWKRIAALVTQNDPKPTVKLKSLIKNPYVVVKPTADEFQVVLDDDEQLY